MNEGNRIVNHGLFIDPKNKINDVIDEGYHKDVVKLMNAWLDDVGESYGLTHEDSKDNYLNNKAVEATQEIGGPEK